MPEEVPPQKPYGAYGALWVGGGMVVGGIAHGISYTYQWLRYGASEPYAVTNLIADIGLAYPRVSWIGAQNIIDWIVARPAGFVLLFTGFVVWWLGGLYTDDFDQQTRDYQNRARAKEIEIAREAKNAENREQQRRKEESRSRREAERGSSA